MLSSLMRLAAFLFIFSLGSCVSHPEKSKNIKTEREYAATFEETWRAVQQTIIAYPLKMNNMDTGQIQTVSLRTGSAFKLPNLAKAEPPGLRYTLTINVLKLSPERTKVSILKDPVVYRDFFSKPENRTSDGLEEMALLYRIGRELEMEKALLNITKKTKH